MSNHFQQTTVEKATLLLELQEAGVRHSPEKVMRVAKCPDGKIIFLEEGNDKSGFQHILLRHQQEFAARGLSCEEIPDAIIMAIVQGKVVGHQQETRPVYEITFNGKTQQIAVTVSENGYIVSANPASCKTRIGSTELSM